MTGSKRSNIETVMLGIETNISELTAVLVDFAQYSILPEEQEILFDLGATFRINSIDYHNEEKM